MKIIAAIILMFNMHYGEAYLKDNLDGAWKPVYQEINGMILPEQSFKSQLLTISDSTYTLVAESVDKGVLRYSAAKMDIYGREGVNKGKHFTCIYKLEGDKLTICYNLRGDKYPDDFVTKGLQMYFLSVFSRNK